MKITISLSPLIFPVKNIADIAGVLAHWGPAYTADIILLTDCTK